MVARTGSEKDRVYALRYRCYRRDESIPESGEERFCDQFDALPNSVIVLAESDEGETMATVRISVVRAEAGWGDSPAQHVFGDHPALQAIAGQSYVEASRLCFGPHARRDAFITLTGYMAALAEFYDTEWLVACPRTEHAATYQRLFGFRPLAEARQYFGVKFQTQLLGVRRQELADFVQGARPMRAAWSNALGRLVNDESLRAMA